MRRWLKNKPRGIYRVLHSAAAIRRLRGLQGSRNDYRAAYDYFRRRIPYLNYAECRRLHIPIGSGVTEAACKTVFTQRFKQSGMTWLPPGGATILHLRVIHLSGLWTQVFQSSLQNRPLPHPPTQSHVNTKSNKIAA